MKLADIMFFLGIVLVVVGCYLVNIILGIFMTGFAFIGVSVMLVAVKVVKESKKDKV